MKIQLFKIFSLLLLLVMVSCAPPPKEDPLQALKAKIPVLPGAVVSADGLQISYPGESLFAEGSVLPLPGGMAVLDPLIDFLMANPDFGISGTVGSAGHDESYDRLLAGKRLDILIKIFQNRGIADERLQIVAAPGEEVPLVLQLQLASASSSPGAKR